MFINLLRSNYEFLFYLSIFYSIYILYKKWINLKLINRSLILNNNSDNWYHNILYFLIIFLFIMCFYFISNNILGFKNISHNEYRIIKLILGFSISILTLYISIKENSFISWKTLFSFLSFCILIFYASLFFDEGWKEFFNEKINSYIITSSFWIIVFISYFSHEYLYVSNIDIVNNLKMKLFKLSECEMRNKPNMMKIEDLLNKEDSNQPQPNNQATTNNIKNTFSNENNDNSRPSTSDSQDTTSVISHDSTISNAHISIMDGTKRMVKGAQMFTNQWKEGKILGEDQKEKKEMLDEIIDLPHDNVFNVMKWRLDWEHRNALTKYIYKRNMPTMHRDKLTDIANAGFNDVMSDKNKKQKFLTRLKAFIKEPTIDKKDLLEKLRKETLSAYIKGEEEAITTGDKIKKPLEIGGRKFKKGGLLAVYEDKKIDAEVNLQQQEIDSMKAGHTNIGRILPSYGRLSIFEIMNRSIGSIVDDFKKLNLDSSTSSNNNEIKTSSVKSQSNSIEPQSNLKNEVKFNNNDSPSTVLENNNIDISKNILIKDDNNESNKKRKIN